MLQQSAHNPRKLIFTGKRKPLQKVVHSSNQYTSFTYSKNKKQVAVSRRTRSKIKNKGNNTVFHVTLMMSLIAFSLFLLAVKNSSSTKAVASPLPTPTPIAKPLQEPVTPTPTVEIQTDNTQSQEAIETYIRRIFTDNADTAIAISHHECGPTNHAYPRCILHTDYEYSVGVFQINLYNKWQNIHADRIPGDTMEEKIAWLKNPYNNTLYAWWVYSTSGFNPWSSYTSGAYLN